VFFHAGQVGHLPEETISQQCKRKNNMTRHNKADQFHCHLLLFGLVYSSLLAFGFPLFVDAVSFFRTCSGSFSSNMETTDSPFFFQSHTNVYRSHHRRALFVVSWSLGAAKGKDAEFSKMEGISTSSTAIAL
jgi:hypothetical protein